MRIFEINEPNRILAALKGIEINFEENFDALEVFVSIFVNLK